MSTVLEIATAGSRAVLVATFLAAAAAKLVTRDQFGETLSGIGVTNSPRLRNTLSWMVPLIEFAIAALLVIGWYLRIVAVIAGVVSLTFALFTLWATRHRPMVSCRCFGPLTSSAFSMRGVLRNIGLIALASILALEAHRFAGSMDASAAQTTLVFAAFVLLGLVIAQTASSLERLSNTEVPQ
jgi:uncharacterized membrane protein YphA (DoxX/SURF4 family)